MIDFLAGAVTLGLLVASGFFLRFWRRTADRLFLAFGVAFALLALNQALAFVLDIRSEPTSFVYALRVLAFILILGAIIDKNLFPPRKPR
ncbi:MAG TPA: DUF5985 family protein [Burkholderiales bacterium]|nr:DUF5985 family protein [Burkholderiales bacterium]